MFRYLQMSLFANISGHDLVYFSTFVNRKSQPRMSLSYREFIECRYIGLFRISKSISYRTSHIEYLDMPSICLYFVFFRRKFSEKSENSLEIPKILRKFRKFSENSENSQKFLKIRRKFIKKKVFL